MKKIVLIGGLGKIGQVIYTGLGHKYDFVIIDINENESIPTLRANTADFDTLLDAVPKDTDILFDLTGYRNVPSLVEKGDFERMTEIYVRGIYNIFEVAKTRNIPKVIYSSTNHVTGIYEKDGLSLLGREIRETDYPKPDDTYGAMKLFGESIARLYSKHHQMNVICLRFGGVPKDKQYGTKNGRNSRAILYHEDLLKIAEAAFESQVDFGVYYAVSENAQKPWSLKKLRQDLNLRRSDFVVKQNSSLAHKLRMNLRQVFQINK